MGFGSGSFGSGTFGADDPGSVAPGGSFRWTSKPLPRVYLTIDDEPVEMSDWSAGSSVGVGHDQFRGTVAASRIRQMPEFTQGSIAKLWTEDGFEMWEGRFGQPPKLDQDGLGRLAAQGHGYEAAKYGSRILARLVSAGAWQPSNVPPLNWPYAGGTVMQINASSIAGSESVQLMGLVDGGGGDDASQRGAALWAPGMKLTRIRAFFPDTGLATTTWRIYSADGPDLLRTQRLEAVTLGDVTQYLTFNLTRPGDCIIVTLKAEVGNAPSRTIFLKSELDIGGVWGDVAYFNTYSEHAARNVCRRLGWDENYITARGVAPHLNLDNAGGAAAMLGYICSLEDWRWCAWEDRGNGPVLDIGPYSRVWEVSARTGAKWDLDPLELVNRIVVQFLTAARTYAEATITADPDPLEAKGITRSASASLADSQFDPTLAYAVAYSALKALVKQRWRGRIRTPRVFEEGSGRDAPYEVRAGDLVRITDFDEGGESLTLRIDEVAYDASGITIGCEAPAIPGAELIAHTSGLGQFASPSTGVATVTGGEPTYEVPGQPGKGNPGGSYQPRPYSGPPGRR